MAAYPECDRGMTAPPLPPEVYRVIDDGTCVLTTLDPRKALLKLQELLDENDVTVAWSETEILK